MENTLIVSTLSNTNPPYKPPRHQFSIPISQHSPSSPAPFSITHPTQKTATQQQGQAQESVPSNLNQILIAIAKRSRLRTYTSTYTYTYIRSVWSGCTRHLEEEGSDVYTRQSLSTVKVEAKPRTVMEFIRVFFFSSKRQPIDVR